MTVPHAPNRPTLAGLAPRIALIYAIAGFAWILFSDMALAHFLSDRALIERMSMVKGWVFVSVTALLLYLLLRRSLASWEKEAGARSLAEAEAREHQALYRSLVELMPAGMFRKDAAGRYVYVNSWFCQIAGLKPEDYLGKTALEVAMKIKEFGLRRTDTATGESIFNQGEAHHEKIMQTGDRVEVEEEWILLDGRRFWLDVMKTPIMDVYGKIAGTQGLLFDVAARKRAEEDLRTLSRRWSGVRCGSHPKPQNPKTPKTI